MSDRSNATLSIGATEADSVLPGDADAAKPRAWARARPEDRKEAGGPSISLSSSRYDDLGVLGTGGMGEVRRVHDRHLGRVVACKTLRVELAAHPAMRARFVAEAEVTAQLTHPGVIPVFDLGELEGGRPYYTMKEVSGRTLGAVRGTGGVDEPGLRRHVGAFVRVVEAVAYAHTRGVTHRDLKPENVMVGAFGEVLVLDWGLAHVAAERVAEPVRVSPEILDRRGSVSGTPAFMPPEQAWGAPPHPTADVYALGALLHLLLVGRPPLLGDATTVLQALRAGVVPAAPSGPEELVALCVRAMASAPEARGSAADLAEGVHAWLDGSQRRERARALVAVAEEAFTRAATLREEAATTRTAAERALAGVAATAPAEEKRAGWALESAAEDAAGRAELAEVEAVETLHAALSHAPLPEARARLADHYRSVHTRAEEAGDVRTTAAAELRLRTYAHPGLARYLDGAGTVSLRTDPPDATVLLHRFVEVDRRLVPVATGERFATPLVDVPLAMGSWLLVVQAEGRLPVNLPVLVRRNEPCGWLPPGADEPVHVHLPSPAEQPPGAVYVPPGWFWAGARTPVFPWERPIERAWTGGFWLARNPVTHGAYLAFVNDLVAQGREEEALVRAGRGATVAGQPLGSALYGRDADGRFVLVPDPQGDVWDPEFPVFLVTLEDAEAYAVWAAARDGVPWRLPDELEREKAARGADRRTYPWGDAFDPTFCRTREGCGARLAPAVVGEPPGDVSVYGAHGLGGNVMDWCAAPGQGTGVGVPEPPADHRVCRGGAFHFAARAAATSARWVRGVVQDRRWDGGFRLACTALSP